MEVAVGSLTRVLEKLWPFACMKSVLWVETGKASARQRKGKQLLGEYLSVLVSLRAIATIPER
jgi:hypothetical protein